MRLKTLLENKEIELVDVETAIENTLSDIFNGELIDVESKFQGLKAKVEIELDADTIDHDITDSYLINLGKRIKSISRDYLRDETGNDKAFVSKISTNVESIDLGSITLIVDFPI